jgi:hypothetical protein
MLAQTLSLSERAIEKHTGALFQKLGLVDEGSVNRRVMAVLTFLEAGGSTSANKRLPGQLRRPRVGYGSSADTAGDQLLAPTSTIELPDVSSWDDQTASPTDWASSRNSSSVRC